jgi:uncharacterized protein (TIGR03435 family)
MQLKTKAMPALFVACWNIFGSAAASAQQPDRPSFELASVKPSEPGDRTWSLTVEPGWRLRITDMTLKSLISYAYSVREHQVSGGPNWRDSNRYDIDAKPDSAFPFPAVPPSPANDPAIRLMAQSLLAERFQLTIHREIKESPVYELVLAKGGSKLKEAKETATSVSGGRALIHGQAAPMSMVVAMLERTVERSVIDKTGLTGKYDFELKWTPDAARNVEGADAPPEFPSLLTALQEQLGLRLRSAKGPAEVIVIDHAEKPEAN